MCHNGGVGGTPRFGGPTNTDLGDPINTLTPLEGNPLQRGWKAIVPPFICAAGLYVTVMQPVQ